MVDKLNKENLEILKRRPDLQINGDFTKDGERLLNNELQIERLDKLPIRLVVGSCSCANRIRRGDVIEYCAWCHKEIIDWND